MSFRGQLYDSTQQRVIREKAEQARFAEIREKNKAAGQSGAWIPPFVLLVGVLVGYQVSKSGSARPSTASTAAAETGSLGHNTSPRNLEAAWTDLREVAEVEDIPRDEQTDSKHKPFCVVRPSTTEQVSQIMKICHRRRIPVYTATTAVHDDAVTSGICIDLAKMNKTLRRDEAGGTITCQPGVESNTLAGLHAAGQRTIGEALDAPIDTAITSRVVAVTVVLADGTTIASDRTTEYDMNALFVGSQSTLGLVTEITLSTTAKSSSGFSWLFHSGGDGGSRDRVREGLGLHDGATAGCMRKIKLALDPLCLLNCNRLVKMECSLHDGISRVAWPPPILSDQPSNAPEETRK